MKIPIEVSARHVHLSASDLKKLFGKDHKCKNIKDLSQKGEFACQETVDLVNGKNKLTVRVLGPTRKITQIEISLTDAHNLGLKKLPKVKLSGRLEGASELTIQGPKGKIKAKVIIAKRHLHCSPETAKKLKIKNGQEVMIKVEGPRGLIFDEIPVRVKPNFKLALHIDTDEANAAGIKTKAFGKLVK